VFVSDVNKPNHMTLKYIAVTTLVVEVKHVLQTSVIVNYLAYSGTQ